MKKRGQVTTFIIVGIVAVIAIVLILFLRNSMGLFISSSDFLGGISENIQGSISDCVDLYSEDGLKLMFDQGGKITPVSYKLYQGKKISYLCSNIPNDEKCLNNLEPLNSWETNFGNYLKLNLEQCINLNAFKSNFDAYEIDYKGYDINVDFLEEEVMVEIKPKIIISKKDFSMEVDNIFRNYDYPVGKIYDIVHDTVNAHATTGEFYNLPYTLSMKGKYEIFVEDKPYPDIIYYIQKKDSENKFYFAIQGEK